MRRTGPAVSELHRQGVELCIEVEVDKVSRIQRVDVGGEGVLKNDRLEAGERGRVELWEEEKVGETRRVGDGEFGDVGEVVEEGLDCARRRRATVLIAGRDAQMEGVDEGEEVDTETLAEAVEDPVRAEFDVA